MPIAIRLAVPQDVSSLRALARASKAYWGYSSEFMRSWEYDRDITEQFISDHEVFCAEVTASLAGFYALSRERPNAHLEHLWVAPEHIGRGVGRALFEHAVEQASSGGASNMVVNADPNAAEFYERMGARRVGEIHNTEVGQVFPVLELMLGDARTG